jgi:serine/threonine-protein kinase RsbW
VKVLAALENGALASALAEVEGTEVLSLGALEELEGFLDADPAFVLVDQSLAFATDMIATIKSHLDGPDRDRVPVLCVGERSGKEAYCVPDAHYPDAEPDPEAMIREARAIMFRRARQRRLFDQELILGVPTVPEAVDKAGDLLEQFVGAAGFTEEETIKLGHTIREAVGNAAEHGNKNDPERTVHINCMRTPDRVAIVVTDEGPGFDTEAFLARADEVSALEHTRSRREHEARPGGLGVFIMKQTCDEIAFNAKGNSIYLMKYLPGVVAP